MQGIQCAQAETAWDFPLSRNQRVQRLLNLFVAEEQQKESDLGRLEEECNKMRRERDEYRAKCKAQESEIVGLRAQVEGLQVATPRGDLNKQELELMSLRAQIAALQNSRDEAPAPGPRGEVVPPPTADEFNVFLAKQVKRSKRKSCTPLVGAHQSKAAELREAGEKAMALMPPARAKRNSVGGYPCTKTGAWSGPNACDGRDPSEMSPQAPMGNCVENLQLPIQAAGCIIGMRGVKIRKIRQESGAAVNLETLATYSHVRIQGTPMQVQHAKRLVLAAAGEIPTEASTEVAPQQDPHMGDWAPAPMGRDMAAPAGCGMMNSMNRDMACDAPLPHCGAPTLPIGMPMLQHGLPNGPNVPMPKNGLPNGPNGMAPPPNNFQQTPPVMYGSQLPAMCPASAPPMFPAPQSAPSPMVVNAPRPPPSGWAPDAAATAAVCEAIGLQRQNSCGHLQVPPAR